MPYDQGLYERMTPLVLELPDTQEKKMFGGIGYLVNGNMCCGIYKDLLVIRLSGELAEPELKKDHVRVMDITGKPMKGWLFVEPEAYAEDEDLKEWIEKSYVFAASLPPK